MMIKQVDIHKSRIITLKYFLHRSFIFKQKMGGRAPPKNKQKHFINMGGNPPKNTQKTYFYYRKKADNK